MSVNPVGNTGFIQSAIAAASRKTGVDFNYLLGQAQVESGLRADARAGTSSAAGLYQFIEQSWLGVVKAHGAEHGMGWAADAISRNAAGRYTVSDPATRQAILQLRNDPSAASLMAAEHAADNKGALEASLGRAATGTDLYMAHFLGLGGARSFLGAMEDDPGRSGAAMFPAAARANRNIFYAGDGSPRSLGDIYQRFAAKLDRGAAAGGATGLASDTLDQQAPARFQQAVEVIMGSETDSSDRAWLNQAMASLSADGPQSTLGRLTMAANTVNPLRPTPDTARIAYLMLASLGA